MKSTSRASGRKNIVILGSTGSLGVQALEVAAIHPSLFRVAGLSTYGNMPVLKKQIDRFNPSAVAIVNPSSAAKFAGRKNFEKTGFFRGDEGLVEIARLPEADVVFIATSGISGLLPTLAALEAGKTVLTANKESLAAAGRIIMETAGKHRARLIPVDSEHSAIFQILHKHSAGQVRKVTITASGGPLLDRKNLDSVTPEEALAHPRWKMGGKTTIDSATLMNKGLELIEASALFSLPYNKIDVVVHPESIVHSLVEFVDGSVMAYLAAPDMRLPIQYALTHPDRFPFTFGDRLRLDEIGSLTFRKPDEKKFPCLALARNAIQTGGVAPAVLSAADEVAVYAFLRKTIRFSDIPVVVEKCLEECCDQKNKKPSLDEILEADVAARAAATRAIRKLKK